MNAREGSNKFPSFRITKKTTIKEINKFEPAKVIVLGRVEYHPTSTCENFFYIDSDVRVEILDSFVAQLELHQHPVSVHITPGASTNAIQRITSAKSSSIALHGNLSKREVQSLSHNVKCVTIQNVPIDSIYHLLQHVKGIVTAQYTSIETVKKLPLRFMVFIGSTTPPSVAAALRSGITVLVKSFSPLDAISAIPSHIKEAFIFPDVSAEAFNALSPLINTQFVGEYLARKKRERAPAKDEEIHQPQQKRPRTLQNQINTLNEKLSKLDEEKKHQQETNQTAKENRPSPKRPGIMSSGANFIHFGATAKVPAANKTVVKQKPFEQKKLATVTKKR